MNNYSKQTWADSNPSYPLSAARLGVIEQGIYDAHYKPTVGMSSVTTTLPNTTETVINWASVQWDTASFWASGVPGRLTAPVQGLYHFWISGDFNQASDTAGDRMLYVKSQTNAIIGASQTSRRADGSADVYLTASGLGYLHAGDYIFASAYQTSGASMTVTTSMVMVLAAAL